MEKYVICLSNEGYAASLEVRKLYELLPDRADFTPSPGYSQARSQLASIARIPPVVSSET